MRLVNMALAAALSVLAIAAHVFKNNLPVKVYKDYGWPAVEIPKMNAQTEN